MSTIWGVDQTPAFSYILSANPLPGFSKWWRQAHQWHPHHILWSSCVAYVRIGTAYWTISRIPDLLEMKNGRDKHKLQNADHFMMLKEVINCQCCHFGWSPRSPDYGWTENVEIFFPQGLHLLIGPHFTSKDRIVWTYFSVVCISAEEIVQVWRKSGDCTSVYHTQWRQTKLLLVNLSK